MNTRILVLLGSISWFSCGLAPSGQAAATEQAAGACPVYTAQPDPRDCVSPECGGYFMHLISEPANLECRVDFTDPYVTGIFDGGTLTQIYPSCRDPLTGNFQPDPENPGFRIFVYYACVG